MERDHLELLLIKLIMNLKFNLNKIEELDEALAVSIKIFNPSKKIICKYHDKNDWLNKINNGGLFISALNNGKVIGFAICYPEENNFHIWNVGVLKEYRRFGVWKEMFNRILSFAAQKNFRHLTLNTYKTKYPNMYSFCLKNGFEEYKKEYKIEGEKSFFVKRI